MITDHWQKYIFQNTRHKSSNTTCSFHHILHAYILAWKCIAFRRMGLVELQMKLTVVNILVGNLWKISDMSCSDYSSTCV